MPQVMMTHNLRTVRVSLPMMTHNLCIVIVSLEMLNKCLPQIKVNPLKSR
jgi:flagellar biosynthesis protein FliR